LREHAIARQPGAEIQPPERRQQIGLHSGEPDHDVLLLGVPQEMLQAFEADDIGIAHALQSQEHVAHTPGTNALFDLPEDSVEFRSGAEEQLALQIVEQEVLVRSVRRAPVAHDLVVVDDELDPLRSGGALLPPQAHGPAEKLSRSQQNQPFGANLERAKGIEPSYEAWEASVLPLNYARDIRYLRYFSFFIWHAFGTEFICARKEISHIGAGRSSSLGDRGSGKIQ
jgi:hypothetical protein